MLSPTPFTSPLVPNSSSFSCTHTNVSVCPRPILPPRISHSFNLFHLPAGTAAAAARQERSRRPVMAKMAKREQELEEIRGKTTEELQEEVVDLKGELFLLRLQKSARNDFKSSEFRRMRKQIARMLTVRRERELEQGINKRMSRKLDKQWKKGIEVRPPPSLRKKLEEEKAAEENKSS